MPEQRSTRRIPIVARVEAQAGGSPHLLLAQNISAGGMLLRAAEPVPVGQVVTLRFTLPGTEREIRLRGVVQHVSPGAFLGVRFAEADPADLAAIKSFVDAA